jgi:hypothetical protein
MSALEAFIGGMANSAASRWEKEAEITKARTLERVKQQNRMQVQGLRNSSRLANTALQQRIRQNSTTGTARMRNAQAAGYQPGSSQYQEFIRRGDLKPDVRIVDGIPAIMDTESGTYRPLRSTEALRAQQEALSRQPTPQERSLWDSITSYFSDDPAEATVNVGMPQVVTPRTILPRSKIDPLLNQARQALSQGANRQAVEQRLREAGVRDGQIRTGLGH